MNLAQWALRRHPFFVELASKVEDRIAIEPGMSLDDLVIALRRPLRPILLALDVMIEDGRLPSGWPSRLDPTPPKGQPTGRCPVRSRYEAATADAGQLALLWTQRRLTREFALVRSDYVRSFCAKSRGRVIFFGDDDLVSPLFAAEMPSWHITTIDIDADVLRRVSEVAEQLGGAVDTIHADLATWCSVREPPDIIVCDPFPTKDGSFEMMFWAPAARMLRMGSALVSTTLPSHKPTTYSASIPAVLHRLGFSIVDQRMSGGAYEVYDFDLLPCERKILDRLQLSCAVHHTKALFAAEKFTDDEPSADEYVDANATTRWMRHFSSHYLTVSAGMDSQARMGVSRSPQNFSELGTASVLGTSPVGLDVSLLLPSEFNARSIRGRRALGGEALFASLEVETGLRLDAEEKELLARLEAGSFGAEDLDAVLALVVRSLESWMR